MSRVEDLIQEYCPNGVEFQTLGNVLINFDSKRIPITKSNRHKGMYPYYGANGIQDYVDGYIFDGTYLLVGEDGSVIKENGTPIINWASGKIWVNNHAHVLQSNSEKISLRFAYFYLQTVNISSFITGGTQPKLNQKNLNKIPFPIPPLPVQDEIVRILDSFTQLEAELEAELEARRKQYEYYRDSLLSFENLEARLGGGIRLMPLSTLGTWSGGGTPSKSQASFWQGPINWFSAKDIKSTHLIDAQDKISKEAVQARGLRIHSPETLIIVARSGILKHSLPVGILEKEGTINQDLKALTTNENVTPKFALHALQNFASQILLKCHKAGGSVDSLDMKKVYSFKVPVPPLSEQERIVSILDNFDALTTDLSSGLPAEIQARRKQYEYYRDKLLTFEEAK
ncbi:hypothetical protein HMPREF9306_01877 [Propionimicrobium lymphophilum ACS-093-V-SCH5]|uniref:Type I restriction modification DNA specificity domain-containing protein n=2 Tax=Propionimicrobium TaxID=203133 RepID=S2VXT1_9ACTN|nr:restriction endonuclease subunit S [Propionimicrobium lymphophilum]EPD32308.1 hypothetical protein HMPREF9306_01877 [Propionimicrobium lymphophilum ACS-093-V-SCH5]